MSRDPFFERLRAETSALRFEPDEIMSSRIAARVRDRISRPAPTAAQFLARWFRPLTATFSALALVATLGVVWFERSTNLATAESLVAGSSSVVEISAGGDVYSVSE